MFNKTVPSHYAGMSLCYVSWGLLAYFKEILLARHRKFIKTGPMELSY